MALQICPNCKEQAFTWTYDEENTPPTSWACNCGYSARENESFIRECNACGTKTQSRLQDDSKTYWWCSSCNAVKLIKQPKYPTSICDIQALAKEFGYPYSSHMQDWEYEVAKLSDIEKYFEKYTSVNDDGTRFILMEMMIETSNENRYFDWIAKLWPRVQLLLRNNFALHEYTIHYWCCFDNENIDDCFYIRACMRDLWTELSGEHH